MKKKNIKNTKSFNKCQACRENKILVEIVLLDGFVKLVNGETSSRLKVCYQCKEKLQHRFKLKEVDEL